MTIDHIPYISRLY